MTLNDKKIIIIPKISRKVTGFKTLPTTKRFKWVKLRRNITPGLKTGPI